MMADRMVVARLPPLSGGKKQVAGFSPRAGHKFEGLTGPTYKIDNTTHALPPPNALKPYVDTTSGAVDTWPAHASSHSVPRTSLLLTKNKNLIVYSEEDMGKPQITPKPRFLEQLEGYLKKELRALGVTEVLPNELRLQAHREVFEYLIEDFKTYKPLLSAIKNEYEMMLAFQRQQIRELDPLKQMLVTVSEQCDQKIMGIREEEKLEITNLKKTNAALIQQMEAMNKTQVDLQTQVKKLTEELAAEYERYRDEFDAKKQLVIDLNDLRYQQDDYTMSKQQGATEEAQEDPVMLKIALKKAREDEKAATQRLNEMVANYGDVIPRRDFENLEKTHNTMKETYEKLEDDLSKLQKEHGVLMDTYKQVVQTRNEYYEECERLKRSSTPRPNWDKCADHINGGMERWQELTANKRSDEKVDILMAEMAAGGAVDSGGQEFFDGQGTGPTVPRYLQHEGPVRNRRLGKRDCALVVKDIWREKVAHDAEKTDGVREKMTDFIDIYLARRFGIPQMKIEWGYNLQDACERYCHDEKIGVFNGVINGNIDEEVYHDQMSKVELLLNQLTNVDIEKGNTEKLSREDMRTAIKGIFPDILDESLGAIVKAAEVELEPSNPDELEYKDLFKEDDEGGTGPFLEEVVKYIKQERMQYVEDIKECIKDNNPVSVDDLKRGLSLADPQIDNDKMEKVVQWVFDTNSEDLSEAKDLELSKVIDRLQNGNIHRVGRRA